MDLIKRSFWLPAGGTVEVLALEDLVMNLPLGVALWPDSTASGYSPIHYDHTSSEFARQLNLVHSSCVEGSLEVEVVGFPGASGTLERGGQQYSLNFPPNDDRVTVSLSTPLVIGEVVATRSPTGALRDAITVPVRYLVPQISTSFRFGPMPVPENPTVGNEQFLVRIDVASGLSGSPITSISAIGLAGLAARQAGGVDPLVMTAAGLSLDPTLAAVVPVSGFTGEDGFGSLQFSLPIPPDPLLVGEVVLFQFAADDGQGIVYSEIVGVAIRQ